MLTGLKQSVSCKNGFGFTPSEAFTHSDSLTCPTEGFPSLCDLFRMGAIAFGGSYGVSQFLKGAQDCFTPFNAREGVHVSMQKLRHWAFKVPESLIDLKPDLLGGTPIFSSKISSSVISRRSTRIGSRSLFSGTAVSSRNFFNKAFASSVARQLSSKHPRDGSECILRTLSFSKLRTVGN